MPAYNTQNPPPALFMGYPMNQATVLKAEALTAAELSQQVNIAPGPVGGSRGICIEGDFNAVPGTFEIDVMEADTDALNQYVATSNGTINTTVATAAGASSTHVRLDIDSFDAQFCALYVKTPPSNSNITFTGRITRK